MNTCKCEKSKMLICLYFKSNAFHLMTTWRNLLLLEIVVDQLKGHALVVAQTMALVVMVVLVVVKLRRRAECVNGCWWVVMVLLVVAVVVVVKWPQHDPRVLAESYEHHSASGGSSAVRRRGPRGCRRRASHSHCTAAYFAAPPWGPSLPAETKSNFYQASDLRNAFCSQ